MGYSEEMQKLYKEFNQLNRWTHGKADSRSSSNPFWSILFPQNSHGQYRNTFWDELSLEENKELSDSQYAILKSGEDMLLS